MTETKIQYIEPSQLKISTHTVTCNINQKLNLYEISRMINIYNPNDKNDIEVLNKKEGGFTNIKFYIEKQYNDLPRGNAELKLPAKIFNNQITLVYKYWGFKEINLKIFTNGRLHMTGIKDMNFEVEHLANVLINMIKSMKWKIWTSRHFKTREKHLDYVIFYNKKSGLCEYYRRNLSNYNICNILKLDETFITKFGNSIITRDILDKKWETWMDTNEIKKWREFNINIAKKFHKYYTELKDKLLIIKEYSIETRKEFYNRTIVFKTIDNPNKEYAKLNDKTYKKNLLRHLLKIIRWFENYENILVNLSITDNKIIDELNTKHITKIKEKIDGSMKGSVNSNVNDTTDYTNGFITINAGYENKSFKYDDLKLKLINGDYSTRFTNNIEIIKSILKQNYRIYSSLNSNKKYPGIITKFKYNDNYTDSTKYQPGVCHCEVNCIKKKKKERECMNITISIFRSGSIMITGSKSIEQIMFVYNFINKFMKDNFEDICEEVNENYRNNNTYQFNDDKKILRKKELYYLKKLSIIGK
jgi:TATA-box binding protein (TBP) (component of TFIID and TFIIIB)